MPRILRTRASRGDYEEIWEYIAARDLSAADRILRQFDAMLATIASTPTMGRKVEHFAPQLRSFPVGNYLIFYRPTENGILLVRIVHGARNIIPEFFRE